MRFGRVSLIAVLVIVLALGAAVFLAFSDFGSAKEPVINGMRLRRYVASTGSAEEALARVGADAIPWLIKGIETEEAAFYRFKARVWRLLPSQWQLKWRNRAPIHPAGLRMKCLMALELWGRKPLRPLRS